MNSNHRHLFGFAGLILAACTGQPREDSPAAGDSLARDPEIGPDDSVPVPEPRVEPAEPAAIALVRGLGHDSPITEVWLDPRARAALSLDSAGNVRLWPELPPGQTDLAALAPIRVPIREPLWLSLASAGEPGREFVVAAIDTAQAARVIEVQIDRAGLASFRERFRTIPRDPLLELHVLDGGERLLALGVDHRIRLYDGRGTLLSELTEFGLAPWQLRLAGPPESPKFAMVLAGPTRLQRFTIDPTTDRLAKLGEPRQFRLDRGLNANDLALLPSGQTAVVLRRPDSKGQRWSLELHDLDSGSVEMIWGEVESEWRPRMHILDDQRVLLEDGVAGFMIDLSQAVAMPAPFVFPETLDALPPESHVSPRKVTLPGTARLTRKHTSVVAGIRVVPTARELLIDPLESVVPTGGDRHFRLGHQPLAIRDLDFEPSGDLLAIAYADRIVVESLSGAVGEQRVPSAITGVERLAFSDSEHLVLAGDKQITICAWRTGEVVSTLDLPEGTAIAIRPSKTPGTGEIARRVYIPNSATEAAYEDSFTYSITRYVANQFGTDEPMAKRDRVRWPDFGEQWSSAIDAAGRRYLVSPENTRKLVITGAGPDQPRRNLAIADRNVRIVEVTPSPLGDWFAIVTQPGFEYGYYGYSDSSQTLSVWSIVGEVAEPSWTTSIDETTIALTWTDDSSRLAFEDQGRLRVVTNTGESLIDRGSRDFHLDDLADVPAK